MKMDLEDWELLPDEKYLQIRDDEGQNEAEFVDMKVKSPELKSSSVLEPQIEGLEAFQYEDKCKIKSEMEFDLDLGESDEGGLDLLKFNTGIGAICSFGITAATICIVLFSSHRKKNKHHKLQFQIFSNEKGVTCEHAK